MGHAAGHLTKGPQLFRLHQVVLGPFEPFVGLLQVVVQTGIVDDDGGLVGDSSQQAQIEFINGWYGTDIDDQNADRLFIDDQQRENNKIL